MTRKTKELLSQSILFVLMLVIATIFLVPIVMMVLGSFKSQGEALMFNLALPTQWHFENYIHVIETGNILRGYANSVIITVSAVGITLICGVFAGVVISRRTDRMGSMMYYYFVFGLTATMQTITTFALLKVLKLYGSYLGVILVFVAINLPFTIMTISSFVKGISKEIDEAAIVDGCTPMQMICKIHIPILKPIMVTNLIITTISVWNNFMIPLYYLNSSQKMTVPLTVYNFYGLYSRNWHYVFAALVMTILPVIILYLCLQKYIVSGMTAGAVKG
ncbi:MAG: carbohydrate ABC transporter permease [Cellulosilyticaceae bacterium]